VYLATEPAFMMSLMALTAANTLTRSWCCFGYAFHFEFVDVPDAKAKERAHKTVRRAIFSADKFAE
jgi:hypothetical protein